MTAIDYEWPLLRAREPQLRLLHVSRAVSRRLAQDTTYARYWTCYMDIEARSRFDGVLDFNAACNAAMEKVSR